MQRLARKARLIIDDGSVFIPLCIGAAVALVAVIWIAQHRAAIMDAISNVISLY